MATLPTSLFWSRTDTAGSDHALLDDRSGLRARGIAQAVTPLPYTCRYEMVTDPTWATVRLEVTAEGGGWQRTVKIENAAGAWRVTTAERGDLGRAMVVVGRPRAALPGIEDPGRLAGAVDVDLAAAPLFHTLPIRRLGLLDPADPHHLTVIRVLVPSLEVVAAEQTYTALGDGRVRYASGTFTTDLTVDAAGYVIHRPGLADRPAGRTP
jgi:uncharacterized protein